MTKEQHVKVAGTRYVQRGTGPWLVDTSSGGSGDLLKAMQDALKSVTDLDAADAGASVHRLQSKIQSFDPKRC